MGTTPAKRSFSAQAERFRFFPAAIILASLFICSLLIWRVAAQAPDGKLHITFFNVGAADGILIKTPTGRSLLIDGGPSSASLSDSLGSRLSLLDPGVDWLIVASTDENQIASLPRVFARYPPKSVLWSGNELASASSQSLAQWLSSQSIPVTRAQEGQILDLGGGATLKVLNVSPLGSTLLVEWQGFRALLPIGENLDTLNQLEYGNAVKPVTVLALARGGAAPLSPADWINNLNPQLVVISTGPGKINGGLNSKTLDALAGRPVLRTDQSGWIEVMTDGKQMWVSVEKK